MYPDLPLLTLGDSASRGQGVSATEAGSVGREPSGQHGLMRAGGLEPPREFPPNGT